MGQFAEYHLNYPFARWRHIFEAEVLLGSAICIYGY